MIQTVSQEGVIARIREKDFQETEGGAGSRVSLKAGAEVTGECLKGLNHRPGIISAKPGFVKKAHNNIDNN